MASDNLEALAKAALGATPGSTRDRAYKEALNPPKTMEFSVVSLYDHRGRRRSVEAMKREGIRVGQIHIGTVAPDSLEGRPTRMASLVQVHPAHAKPTFGDLYDPQIVFMDGRTFVLRGFTARDGGYGVELVLQAWLVRPW
jgi:hypothetical protein